MMMRMKKNMHFLLSKSLLLLIVLAYPACLAIRIQLRSFNTDNIKIEKKSDGLMIKSNVSGAFVYFKYGEEGAIKQVAKWPQNSVHVQYHGDDAPITKKADDNNDDQPSWILVIMPNKHQWNMTVTEWMEKTFFSDSDQNSFNWWISNRRPDEPFSFIALEILDNNQP